MVGLNFRDQPAGIEGSPDMALIEKTAILHVHTDASDGTASIEEIIDEAKSSGVDILGINDHNTLAIRENGFWGWCNGLYVLPGAELEDSVENNHLLVYGIDRLPDSYDTEEQINFVNSNGGICIAAHPTETAGKLPGTRSYKWTRNNISGLSGVEVWNYMSLWKSGITLFNFPKKLMFPDRYVEHPDPAAVEFWETAGGCAIAGPDAHAFKYGAGPLMMEIFPYKMLFKRLRTHILLENELSDSDREAERQIICALGSEMCFSSNRIYGDATGYRVKRIDGIIQIDLPGKGEIVISRMGKVLWNGSLTSGRHDIEIEAEGRLMVEVLRKGRTWIFSGVC